MQLLYTSLVAVLLAVYFTSWTEARSLAQLHSSEPLTKRQSDTSSSNIYETRFPNVTWDNEQWILKTTNLDQNHYQSRMSLANGYIGINVAALGPFFDIDEPVDGDMINGWPLFGRRQTFATIAGFWDSQPELNGTNYPWLSQYGWDTAISGVPHWAGIHIVAGEGNVLDANTSAEQIENFSTSLNMQQGVMNWAFTWSPPNEKPLNISYQMFLHKVNINQAFVQLNVTSDSEANITLVNVLNGDCASRTTFTDKGTDGDFLFAAVNPNGINNVTGFVYTNMTVEGAARVGGLNDAFDESFIGANRSSIAGAVQVSLRSGQPLTATKFVGIASTDAFPQPKKAARNAATDAMMRGYASALQSHMEEWAILFPASSVDDFAYSNGSLPEDPNIIESAIMAVTNPYYILQNTISESAQKALPNATINQHSIAVGGLGSDSYAGQIFWDADTWMQPGIVTTFPYAAQGISNYRKAIYPQAQANLKTAYQSSKNDTYFDPSGAIYPWMSGRVGNCTATGPCFDYEYHLNGDIARAFVNYLLASGDEEYFQSDYLPVLNSIATTYSNLLEKNGSRWALTNLTDPDEFANHVDNGGFTMPLIAQTLQDAYNFSSRYNQSTNTTWLTQAENVLLSRNEDANIILEYTGMNGSINVKQADVVLVTYPLAYGGENYTAEDSLSDLDYYANKQSQDGPAMTYSIFSIIANYVSPSGCSAYTYQLYSTHPYTRGPWFQLSEQLVDNFEINGGFHPAFPFLTGHGGAEQVVLYGYLGLRLLADNILHVDPNLPPQIPQLRYRTFYWQGIAINAYSNQTHTTLSRSSNMTAASGTVPNATLASADIQVGVGPVNGEQDMYTLSSDGSVTFENRQIGNIKSVPGNSAQCRPIQSDSEWIPGQFPESAVDGASSTKWQPIYANETSQITVSLEPGQRILGFTFEWAQAPAYNYTIFLHNDSSTDAPDTFGIATAQTVVQDALVSISSPNGDIDPAAITPVMGNSSELWFNGTQIFTNATLEVEELMTARFATLAVWGSLYNGSLTARNMSGDGCTVAEWTIIVEEEDSTGSDKRSIKSRRADTRLVNDPYLGGWRRKLDMLQKARRT